jgi:hypothetical protein
MRTVQDYISGHREDGSLLDTRQVERLAGVPVERARV